MPTGIGDLVLSETPPNYQLDWKSGFVCATYKTIILLFILH